MESVLYIIHTYRIRRHHPCILPHPTIILFIFFKKKHAQVAFFLLYINTLTTKNFGGKKFRRECSPKIFPPKIFPPKYFPAEFFGC